MSEAEFSPFASRKPKLLDSLQEQRRPIRKKIPSSVRHTLTKPRPAKPENAVDSKLATAIILCAACTLIAYWVHYYV